MWKNKDTRVLLISGLTILVGDEANSGGLGRRLVGGGVGLLLVGIHLRLRLRSSVGNLNVGSCRGVALRAASKASAACAAASSDESNDDGEEDKNRDDNHGDDPTSEAWEGIIAAGGAERGPRVAGLGQVGARIATRSRAKEEIGAG